jgi:hypothetical protein
MRIMPFQPSDLDEIDLQPAQAGLRPHLSELVQVYEQGVAVTVRSVAGHVLACAGLIWTTRGAHIWALLSRNPPLVTLHRMALRAFSVYPDVRMTATVETDFAPGQRWLEMLGFRRDILVEGLGLDGRDHYVYVREAA